MTEEKFDEFQKTMVELAKKDCAAINADHLAIVASVSDGEAKTVLMASPNPDLGVALAMCLSAARSIAQQIGGDILMVTKDGEPFDPETFISLKLHGATREQVQELMLEQLERLKNDGDVVH